MIEDKLKTIKATLLGDGYVSPKRIGKVNTFRMGIEHSTKQKDYLQFKASKINKEMGKKAKVYERNTRNMVSYDFVAKHALGPVRDKYYPNGKKSLPSILADVTDPIYTLSIWLGDDGSVHWDTRGSRKNKNPRIIICACDQNQEQHEYIVNWFKNTFGFEPKIIKQNNSKRKKSWNLIRFSTKESLMIWSLIKPFLKDIPSMDYKFRILESELQKNLQNVEYNLSTSVQLQYLLDENVCRTSWRHEEVEDKKPLR